MADATVKTLFVKTRRAAKDYPAFGVKKGQTIYKWRADGRKFISLSDPRVTAPVETGAVVVAEGEPVTVEPKAAKKRAPKAKVAPAKRGPKPGLRKAAQAKAEAPVTEDLPPE